MEQQFIDIQNNLQKQIERVEIKLSFYKRWHDKNFGDKFDKLSKDKQDEIRKQSFQLPYNYYHDKLEELQEELEENFHNYQQWHFDQFGWCAY